MCGIYGTIGKNSVSEVLNGIKRLEYRGYDSAGIAFISDEFFIEGESENVSVCDRLFTIKAQGQISKLEEIVGQIKPFGSIAIGHTRWATHGKPSVANSHPHLSQDGKWAIVHNGIIENYKELKDNLTEFEFKSETDTEVVAKLLEKYYTGNVLETISKVCEMLKGSYAFAIITTYQPDKIFVAKYGSPVVVGRGEGGVVCSDLNSLGQVSEAYVLENGQFAIVTKEKVEIFDEKLNSINLKNIASLGQEKREQLVGYEHYMLKEIDEVPAAILRTVFQYDSFEKMRKVLPLSIAKKVKKVLVIGCGTAFHAGLIGKKLFEEIGIKVEAEIASEFRYNKYIPEKNTLAIFVSQSGETADTIKALTMCKEYGLTTLAMTNVRNSSICFEADRIIYTNAGAEIGVASTKAYNCQVALFYMLASYFKSLQSGEDLVKSEANNLKKISQEIRNNDNKKLCQQIASQIASSKSIYMIGRGYDYEIAREASLKLKEISYIHCEAYPAGELKHGTISLIDEDTFVFAFATQAQVIEKTMSNVSEVISRGGKVIAFSQHLEDKKALNRLIKLPNIKDRYMPLFVIGYMQLISYYTSIKLGNNPDKPRSLAKSVTVE